MLEKKKVEVKEERAARKAPLSDSEAKKLLASVEEVVIAKGQKSRTLPAKEAKVDDLRGPTGNIRAPILRKGKRLLVGFSESALLELIG